MKFRLIRTLAGLAAVAFAAQAGAQAGAQTATPATNWPQHPVRIVVPFQAGSATDLISRQLGAALATELGQPFVVEARPGAAAAIGSASWRVRRPTATRC
jgi:tripartite-type tricarboxylate transporter receptor subunit TctC